MATRKKTTIKTPEAIVAARDEKIDFVEVAEKIEEIKTPEVAKPLHVEISAKKEVDFSLVQQVLANSQLKSGEAADDKLSIIALKFYQRINKLPITGKLDEATLKDMGLN